MEYYDKDHKRIILEPRFAKSTEERKELEYKRLGGFPQTYAPLEPGQQHGTPQFSGVAWFVPAVPAPVLPLADRQEAARADRSEAFRLQYDPVRNHEEEDAIREGREINWSMLFALKDQIRADIPIPTE